jgi:hypothetical protein
MPTVPLPQLTRVPLGQGDLPVSQPADVSAEWAPEMMQSDAAPVRDAIQAGEYAMLLEYQRAVSYATDQSDPLHASGEYADEIGDEHGVHRQGGETDASYLPRINATPSVVDPNDICAAADVILAPYTPIQARYAEHLDAFHLAPDLTTAWSSHVFNSPNQTPNYPDRHYDVIVNRRPGGAIVFDDVYGRIFILRVPDISSLDANVAAVFDGTEQAPFGFFVSNGPTVGFGTAFVWSVLSSTNDIYNAIVSKVESMRGMSMRFIMLVDPKLLA